MVLITRYHKKCRIAFLRVGLIALALSALFIPVLKPVKSVGNNIFTLVVNGKEIGRVDTEKEADSILIAARKEVVGDSNEVVLIDAKQEIVGSEVLVAKTDDPVEMISKVVDEYKSSIKETMKHSYTVKIDDFVVNVASSDDVKALLDAAIAVYTEEGLFYTTLATDKEREIPVFVPEIIKREEETEDEEIHTANDFLDGDGFFERFDDIFVEVEPEVEPTFDDFDYGIQSVSFADKVEVVESYLPSYKISSLQDAIDQVTNEKEEKTVYEVVAGDSLSGIALKTGITIDQIIELNETITSANSVIRVGDEITVTVPQPELSIYREELVYYEGTYEADIIYQYNDDWYTTKEVTLQDPSSGYHKAVEKHVYLNNDLKSSEVVMEEIIAEAVPKIVEKGTKIPPTYIKPISGGVLTSKFGARTSTIKGMSSYHQAVDWGVPRGTSVVASCGGTVTQAGWMSSYGYVVFINHPDGRQTRYAHLSSILVSKGDYVSQGQKIALSGNTGVSTGPHLHFEMRINGTAVNPLNYISY